MGKSALRAPFPYFGGKSRVAEIVWQALGDPAHYIEPFFGSGAVLLARRNWQGKIETINDADGHICNVWRSLQQDPDQVARWCDWPVNHADLIARKKVLNTVRGKLTAQLCEDDGYCDPKLAGYWIWSACCGIGNWLNHPNARPHVIDSGKGVHKKSLYGTPRYDRLPKHHYSDRVYQWFRALSERLRYVRVVCGDWSRVCSGDWQDYNGLCGIFFDPPYSDAADRDKRLYNIDSPNIAHEVRQWCLERGSRPSHRIVLAGYYDEHAELLDHGWRVHRWTARGGYDNLGQSRGRPNRKREALFISPHCLPTELFA